MLYTDVCYSRVCLNNVCSLFLNVPFSPRDAEIMQQKQKKSDEGGKGGTKSK